MSPSAVPTLRRSPSAPGTTWRTALQNHHFASARRPLRRVVILAEGQARELEKARSLRRKAHNDATDEALLLRGSCPRCGSRAPRARFPLLLALRSSAPNHGRVLVSGGTEMSGRVSR